MKNPEVLIRKYPDRRLYDTSSGRYVKLDDIARVVRDGSEVRVVDGRTGKDVTHIILTQIIAGTAKERQLALPLQLLTQIVRASDKATHDFLSWYLKEERRLDPVRLHAAICWQATLGERRRTTAKSNNSAAASTNCRRALRSTRNRHPSDLCVFQADSQTDKAALPTVGASQIPVSEWQARIRS